MHPRGRGKPPCASRVRIVGVVGTVALLALLFPAQASTPCAAVSRVSAPGGQAVGCAARSGGLRPRQASEGAPMGVGDCQGDGACPWGGGGGGRPKV